MHYSLEMLTKGQGEIVAYYQAAAERWQHIWLQPEARDLYPFAHLLQEEQYWFESNCGGRSIGQEVMVVSGLAGLYATATGFDRNLTRARLLYDAIQSSYCSIEVKFIAEKVARSYNLLNFSRV